MDTVKMFVNGQAMSGGTLHDALNGATFLGPATTSAGYRFFSIRDEFPGLHPVASGGASVTGELYAVPYAMLQDQLLPREPPELELGVIRLSDGSGSLSMQMRGWALTSEECVDITTAGGWLEYLQNPSS
jgi:gamma-glutamylcyclotransferase (GGCT)/AIG2-like uncharacterized protein YtfP